MEPSEFKIVLSDAVVTGDAPPTVPLALPATVSLDMAAEGMNPPTLALASA
jgi:hypothetical protein